MKHSDAVTCDRSRCRLALAIAVLIVNFRYPGNPLAFYMPGTAVKQSALDSSHMQLLEMSAERKGPLLAFLVELCVTR